MNRYMEKAILNFGVVFVGASLLSACNTTQDSRAYVEPSSSSRSAQEQTVVVGKANPASAAESNVSVGQRRAAERHHEEESFHAPAG